MQATAGRDTDTWPARSRQGAKCRLILGRKPGQFARKTGEDVMSAQAAARQAGNRMPADVAEKIRAIGPVIDPPATFAVYAPLHEREPYPGVRIVRDATYGPDERHALDVFVPENASGPRPVFMFVHGGGYTAGHKRQGDNFYFDNIMLWAARNGMIGVNATYRLAPDHAWPAGAADVGAAVKWVRENIGRHGGDPKRLFLAGHSAGATHVGCYAVMPQFQPQGGPGLAGLILLSGVYDLSIAELDERYASYFGSDRSKLAERSPFAGLLKLQIPLFTAYTELEPPPLLEQSERLVAALKRANRPARILKLDRHSHISITMSINSGDTQLSDAMLDFVRAHA
jgi:triacylglycerol lipase